MINILCGNGKRVIAVAWTGIAAILLPGGKTCHSAFRLPLNLQQDTVITGLTTKEKEQLLHTDVIIWDEASMADKWALEAVDRLLRDITSNDDVPFGGRIFVMGGDFRQVLPVVPGGSRLQILAKCVKYSILWQHFRQFRLKINMRANANETAFANWLLKLGNDELPEPPVRKTDFSVSLPRQIITQDVVSDLFPEQFDGSDIAMLQRVILTPFNDDCRQINERVLDRLRGKHVW